MMKEISDFDGYYADDSGHIYSDYKKGYLSEWVDNVGYKQVILYKDNKRYYRRVHKLIADTFLDKKDGCPYVNHKNGNKLKNELNNLEYVTNSYNTKHAYDHDLYLKKRGGVSIKAVDKITKEIFIFESIRECARELNINRKTLTSIIKNNKTNNYGYDFEIIKE